MAIKEITIQRTPFQEPLNEKPFDVRAVVLNSQKKGKRYLFSKTDAPLPQRSLDEKDKKIPLETIQYHTSYIVIASAFMEKMEAMGKAGLEFTEENIDRAMKLIQEATAESRRVERSMEESSKQSGIWEIVGHIAGGILDIANIAIGATLLASANPLLILAGIGMIISGIIAFSCLILERTGTKNDITLGFQIAGGVIGLIGGAVFFGTGTGSIKIVLQIALGLITAATHGSRAVSYLHQQDSLKEEARSERLVSDLSLNKDNLEIASKLLTDLDEKMLENTTLIIQALQREEDILRRLVNIQPIRG